jgi:hypothetical protein
MVLCPDMEELPGRDSRRGRRLSWSSMAVKLGRGKCPVEHHGQLAHGPGRGGCLHRDRVTRIGISLISRLCRENDTAWVRGKLPI